MGWDIVMTNQKMAEKGHPEMVDFWLNKDGELGVICIDGSANNVSYTCTLDDLKATNPKIYRSVMAKYVFPLPFTEVNIQLPYKPDIESEDTELYDDMRKYAYDHIQFIHDCEYDSFVAWPLLSHIMDAVNFSPRQIFKAVTASGKSRALEVSMNLSYRPMIVTNPTGATLWRTIEKYHPTIFIDTYHDLAGINRSDADHVFEDGFTRGRRVPRCNINLEVEFFDTFAPMAIATKEEVDEDFENRAINYQLVKNTREVNADIDFEAGRKLRTRELAFRYQCATDVIDLAPVRKKAKEIVDKPVKLDGKNIILESRTREIARSLMLPAIKFGHADAVLEVLALSQESAKDSLLVTPEAQCFYAIQALVNNLNGQSVECMTTRMTTEQFNRDKEDRGDNPSGIYNSSTRTMTAMIKRLGYPLKTGQTDNTTTFSSVNFEKIHEANLSKYGKRPDKLESDIVE